MLISRKSILVATWKYYSTFIPQRTTAGIIMIGDEILKGQVKDTNSHFMCKLLYNCGVKVEKISVIGDERETIGKEIQDFSKTYTYVITSGGIGPTHDDVTYEGLAEAFDDSLQHHPVLLNIVEKLTGRKDPTSPSLKMAHVALMGYFSKIPTKATLKFGQQSQGKITFPCVTLNNVYTFPGSPVFFERYFESLCKQLFLSNQIFFRDEIYLNKTEEFFANALTFVSKEFPHVVFGSYPENNHCCRVTMESNNQMETMKAKEKFCTLIPPDIIMEYHEFIKKHPQEIFEKTYNELTNIYLNPEKVVIRLEDTAESMIILYLAWLVNKQSQTNKIQVICLRDTKYIQRLEKRFNINVCELDRDAFDKSNFKVLLIDQSGKVGKECFHDSTIVEPLIDWNDNNKSDFVQFFCLTNLIN